VTFVKLSLDPDALSHFNDATLKYSRGIIRPAMCPTNQQTYNVLFLCTGNSARSIIAEALMNQVGHGRFHAYSAGSFPTGKVNPLAIELLDAGGLPHAGARSKSWDEFARPGAPRMDFILTVCDNAAGEICPAWPRRPITAHWSVPDPAAVHGSDEAKRAAFVAAAAMLRRRIELLVNLPVDKLDAMAVKAQLQQIGNQ
jgi:arsenate reductase